MKISVALTTYDGATFVLEQLTSILNQTRAVDEVIIYDDVSEDHTTQIVKAFIKEHQLESSWHFYENSENRGYASNFYQAITKCSGDIIFLSDQDDIWLPDKVDQMLTLFLSHPAIVSMASSFSLCDEKGEATQIKLPHNRKKNDGSIEKITLKSLIGTNYIRGCTMAFKREILLKEKLYPFKGNLLGHDWLINMFASIKGENIFYNKILMKYRVHQKNTSFVQGSKFKKKSTLEKRILGIQEQKDVLKNFSLRSDISDEIKQKMFKQIKMSEQRIKLLQERNFFKWLKLFLYIREYSKIYGDFFGGLKVYFGDYIYSNRKNEVNYE